RPPSTILFPYTSLFRSLSWRDDTLRNILLYPDSEPRVLYQWLFHWRPLPRSNRFGLHDDRVSCKLWYMYRDSRAALCGRIWMDQIGRAHVSTPVTSRSR